MTHLGLGLSIPDHRHTCGIDDEDEWKRVIDAALDWIEVRNSCDGVVM